MFDNQTLQLISFTLAVVIGLAAYWLIKRTTDEFDRWYTGERPRSLLNPPAVLGAVVSFLAAAFVVEHTDLVLTTPRRLADVLKGRGAFRVFPVPFALPDYEVKQHWHERFHHDDGNRWLRRLIARLLAEDRA